MIYYYQIKVSGGQYYGGGLNWTNTTNAKTFKNLAMCHDCAVMLAKKFGSVIIVKRWQAPNGTWKEMPLKVVTKH